MVLNLPLFILGFHQFKFYTHPILFINFYRNVWGENLQSERTGNGH